MNKLFSWFAASNRYKHVIGGFVIGALSNTNYCAALSGIGVAGALEFKDKQHGGSWDWTDFAFTISGVVLGRLIRIAVCCGI
jgi:hypothetical protein